jgi:hypothetical protein
MFFSRKVDVTFVDAATGQVFARTEMAPGQLPKTFLLETTMHLGNEPWAVVRAEPATRAEFARTRRLVLTLRRVRVEMVDPREILFSLPTLNDRLPDEAEAADGNEAALTEDDWRQVEFVSASLRFVVDDEIGEIERIHAEQRAGIGFRQLHVRSRVEPPLEGVTIGDVRALGLGAARALRLAGHPQRVRGGFAHELPGGWRLYGVAAGEAVTALGLDPSGEAPPAATIAALEAFAREHDLILADWCRCAVGEPGTESFARIFA